MSELSKRGSQWQPKPPAPTPADGPAAMSDLDKLDKLIPADAPIRQGEIGKCRKHFYGLDGPCTCPPAAPENEPVAWEARFRYGDGAKDWSVWSPCTKEEHDRIVVEDPRIEARALFTHPPEGEPVAWQSPTETYQALFKARTNMGVLASDAFPGSREYDRASEARALVDGVMNELDRIVYTRPLKEVP